MADLPLVLVVESHVLVQMSLAEGLHDAGFEIILASNATDATQRLEEDGEQISALVTDTHLAGGASGRDVARRSRDLGWTFPIVYTTVHQSFDGISGAVPDSLVVSKPYCIEQIVGALSTLLDKSEGPAHQA